MSRWECAKIREAFDKINGGRNQSLEVSIKNLIKEKHYQLACLTLISVRILAYMIDSVAISVFINKVTCVITCFAPDLVTSVITTINVCAVSSLFFTSAVIALTTKLN